MPALLRTLPSLLRSPSDCKLAPTRPSWVSPSTIRISATEPRVRRLRIGMHPRAPIHTHKAYISPNSRSPHDHSVTLTRPAHAFVCTYARSQRYWELRGRPNVAIDATTGTHCLHDTTWAGSASSWTFASRRFDSRQCLLPRSGRAMPKTFRFPKHQRPTRKRIPVLTGRPQRCGCTLFLHPTR